MSGRPAASAKLENLMALYALDRADPAARDGLPALRERVLRQVDVARARFRSRSGRLWAAQSAEYVTFTLVEDVLHDPACDEAMRFRLIEALRARALLDQMTATAQDFPSPELAAHAAEQERAVLHYAPSPAEQSTSERDHAVVSQLYVSHPELVDDVEALFAAAGAGLVGGRSPCALGDVMAALRPDEVLIEFYEPKHVMRPPRELWALVITHDAARAGLIFLNLAPDAELGGWMGIDGQAPVNMSLLSLHVAALRSAVQEDDPATPDHLARLHDLLIAPLAALGVDTTHRHWIIVPDAALHGLPFAALRAPDGEYLGSDVALSIVPSASVWLELQRSPPPLARFLGFANPTLSNCPALLDAERELARVRELLENRGLTCEAYIGPAATESRLKARVAGQNILHLATHGAFATAEALDFHELLLAASGDDDGRVRAYEFRTLDLREMALATLGVCDSGTYRVGPGNEIHGLVAALLTAGARDVVATLWPVRDATTARLITRFYTTVVAVGPAEALRRARVALIATGAAVRDWAGFVVVGPGRHAAPAQALPVRASPA